MRLLLLHFTTLFFITTAADAAVQLPTGLTRSHREEVLKILGLGSGGKILTDPYPLGGYAGVEIGVTVESISAEDIATFGNRDASAQDELTFIGLSVGKGVYNNLDLYLHFVPYFPSTEISRYGAMVRWGFFQAQSLPLSLSLNLNAEISNFSNLISTRTTGADIIGGINVRNIALYAGAGPVSSNGTFVGRFTDTGTKQKESVNDVHTVIGIAASFGDISLAAQLDRYTQPVYSGKVGLRF